jgi:hypothetical protein
MRNPSCCFITEPDYGIKIMLNSEFNSVFNVYRLGTTRRASLFVQ